MKKNSHHSSYAKTLPAPVTSTTLIGQDVVHQVIEGSRLSPRKRIILPFHKGPESPMHRMLNAMQPYSYIQPHRHLHPPKAESILVLQGAILSFLFSPAGEVNEVHTLAAGADFFGVDSEPGVFHTFLALTADTVLFEVKPGPYKESSDKDFASWAPAEGAAETKEYMEYLYSFGETAPPLF
ncbi:MAG: WbuC family cupin fold metalloprotein [Desulforhopalus sp.]